jgi:hypothetical protein
LLIDDVPFQMYAYRVMEKENARAVLLQFNKEKQASDYISDDNLMCGDDGAILLPGTSDSLLVSSPFPQAVPLLNIINPQATPVLSIISPYGGCHHLRSGGRRLSSPCSFRSSPPLI